MFTILIFVLSLQKVLKSTSVQYLKSNRPTKWIIFVSMEESQQMYTLRDVSVKWNETNPLPLGSVLFLSFSNLCSSRLLGF